MARSSKPLQQEADNLRNYRPHKYTIAAREAIPAKAACFDCGRSWFGEECRTGPAAHRKETGHSTWTESHPKP